MSFESINIVLIYKNMRAISELLYSVGFCSGQWRTQEFFFGWGSTNSVEDRGQRTGIWGR
jgi:hypothetical protein